MSIASAARLATQVDDHQGSPPATLTGSQRSAAALQRITTYIPSEALAIYIGLAGLFQDQAKDASTKVLPWWLYYVGLGSVLFFTWASYRPKGGKRWTRFIWLLIFGSISFTAYSMALPATPFLDLSASVPKVGTGAAIVLAAALPALASKLRLKFKG